MGAFFSTSQSQVKEEAAAKEGEIEAGKAKGVSIKEKTITGKNNGFSK